MHITQTSLLNINWSSLGRSITTSILPWSGIILGTSAAALIGLGTYRWNQQPNQNADHTFSVIKEKVKRAYAYVFGGFTLTAAAAIASHISGLSLRLLTTDSFILPLGLGLTSVVSLIATLAISKESSKAKHIAWGIFNVSMGAILSPLGFLNKKILAQAAAISFGIGGGLSLAAFYAPDKRFLKWEGPLMVALSSLTIASAVACFFPGTAFAYGVDRASLYGGLLIFSGLFMASTQRLIQEAETKSEQQFDPIRSAMAIYLDGMNIFIRILRILVENKKTVNNE